MKTPIRIASLACLTMAGTAASAGGDWPEYAPPGSYYAGATGTGSVLQGQLTSAMSAGQIFRNYGNFRSSARIHDQDPDIPGNLLLSYSRQSVRAQWDGGVTWNREHVWPQSRQPGSASNDTTGNLGDPHALRPANPSVNSSRGNKPFGFDDTSGVHRSLGSFYFPGDFDKGDFARMLFYSQTRYGPSLGITLVDGTPFGNQMGGLSSLMSWHYSDPPDEFEVRRNHAIYSSELNPWFTNNRNAFVDLPEVAWSIYMNQENDTRLWVGDSVDSSGFSEVVLDVNAVVGLGFGAVEVPLNKTGQDGTYYSVSTTTGVESSISGRHNAFAIGPVDLAETIVVTAAPGSTDSSGVYLDVVMVDNLDITTGGGTGRGANDAEDLITVNLSVFEPSDASFESDSDVNELALDLGTIGAGEGDLIQSVDLFNIVDDAMGAPMDVELLSVTGDSGAISTGFSSVSSVVAGGSASFQVSLDDGAIGSYEAVITLRAYHDRAMFTDFGVGEDLVLTVSGVVGGACLADFAEPFGVLNFFDLGAFLTAFGEDDASADLFPAGGGDGQFNFFDLGEFLNEFSNGCP